MKRLATVLCMLSGLAVAAPALADVHLNYSVEGDGEALQSIMIRNGIIRLDQDDSNWSLFDTNKREMIVIDGDKQEYMVLDEELMEALGDMDKLIERVMEDALKDMPESQREQMRGMMSGMMGGIKRQIQASIPEQTIEETGETREIAGHSCEVVRILHDGKLFMETCGVEPASMDIPGQDLESIQAMQEYIKDMVESIDGMLGTSMAASSEIALGTIPVETRQYQNGEQRSVSVLEDLSTDELDDALFAVPDGYRKQETPLPSL